ncbi:MAG: transposase [Bacteroidetes bacterium]|nr:transposase [Bacteroidota bacterium]
MQFNSGEIYHIYNRGNNKQTIFFKDENYFYFLEKIRKYIYPNCDILAWCLMPNHFHFLIHANDKSCELIKERPLPVSNLVEGFRLALSSYSKAINVQEHRTGNLFQQKTKSKSVYTDKEDYSLTTFHYIHQNPVKAGLVEKLEDWEFSSFKDYAELRKGKLCNKQMAIDKLELQMGKFIENSYLALDEKLVSKIY